MVIDRSEFMFSRLGSNPNMAMEEEQEERMLQRAARARVDATFSCNALLRHTHAPADKEALDNILFRCISPSFSLPMESGRYRPCTILNVYQPLNVHSIQ